MKNFSIRELEAFSQIKAHTIRIWEKRFTLFQPQRNKGNYRFYTLEEVIRLLHIALLNKNGFKISGLAKMDLAALEQKTASLTSEEDRKIKAVHNLIVCMFSSNIEEFESVLDYCVFNFGVDATLQDIIIPFLEKVNLVSYRDSSYETHFVVTAIRKKIILSIEKTGPSVCNEKAALLFLPRGEHYDLLLLYMNYIIKNSGLTVLYLGTNISEENLKAIAEAKKPDFFYTYISPEQHFNLHVFADYLNVHLPQAKLFVAQSETKPKPDQNIKNVIFFHFKEVEKTLSKASFDASDTTVMAV